MSKNILLLILHFCAIVIHAQTDNDSIAYAQSEQFLYLIEGDSVPNDAIHLKEVFILSDIKFEDKIEKRKYLILKRKTRKVYPYAKMAADTLSKLVLDLNYIEKRRHRRKYIKRMQRFMEDRFTPELKKLTRTEGQILVKLIHRQTGVTMYELIKEYRNGFKAFIYDRTAHLFNISLKRKFEPKKVYEDYLIEDILERSFQDGILEKQPPAIYVPILDLIDIWKGYDESDYSDND